MSVPNPPKPDTIRKLDRGFGWIDHRFKWFWDDMSQAELLLYFFLVTTCNEQGCSWWSSRKICKILKIGPATLITARNTLEQRHLIATSKDEFSQRTVYQVLPLPMHIEEHIEVPHKASVKKKSPKDESRGKDAVPALSDEQVSLNMQHLLRIKELLD